MGWQRVAAGFALAGVVLAVFLWSFGAGRVAAALDAADGPTFGVAIVASLGATVMFAAALYVLISPVPGAPRGRAFVGGFMTATVLRALAPWGRSGGSLLTAAALDRRGDTRYEELLGATLAAEAIAAVGSAVVALAGIGALALAPGGGKFNGAAVLVAGFLLALGLGVVVVLGAPGVVVALASGLLGALRCTVGRVSASADRLILSADVVSRTERFLGTAQRVVSDPGVVGPALGFTGAAALLRIVPLWASLRAVGEPVAFPVVMVLVPLTAVAALVPLPGGTGGVEFALVGLLVAATSVSPVGAAAAVLLYRLSTYWLALGLGVVGVLLFDGRVTFDPAVSR